MQNARTKFRVFKFFISQIAQRAEEVPVAILVPADCDQYISL